ncbi:MAG: fibrillarin-like rRNA/tRNA 2'-O-methyltransferase [Methanomicrobiales archaeon]|nr:fibrillarin-like rRNA/tRNA 2'-O-methyltransferase [Methanomicrobiales archaeon]
MIWIGNIPVSPGEGGVYGERMLEGYRVWDPFRSKFSALHMLGKEIELSPEMRVLYLGAAHGTTVSHVADYVEVVYAIERAPLPMRHLLRVAERRKNVIPILADAREPETYAHLLEEVDLLYQDVADQAQVEIALRNRIFLKTGGLLVLMLKVPCIDCTSGPEAILESARDGVAKGYEIFDHSWLAPYHEDHAAIMGKKKVVADE